MSLTSLGEYLLFLVCLNLPLGDITSLRQVCRVLCDTTQTKGLWIRLLEQQVLLDDCIVPRYLKPYESLDAVALEALVRRVARLTHKRETGDLSPAKVWHLNALPQSITWLRLVSGSWLFVASSDNYCSKISCWNLSLVFQGRMEPLAEAFLPGRVKTGKLEVQESGVVLALGLGPESQSVHIITLRQASGCHVFSELCCIEGSSHVLMLCGDLVGCSVRHEAIVPHIVNWKDRRIHDILPPPGGLDVPGRRNVPHLMTIWNRYLVIVRVKTLELYTLPSGTGDPSVFKKLLNTHTIWEVVVCPSIPTPSSNVDIPPLRLITISPTGVELCIVEPDMLGLDDGFICPNFCLAQAPNYDDPLYHPLWYRLCIGEAGHQMLWVSPADDYDNIRIQPPHFIYSTVPLHSYGIEKAPRIAWSNGGPDQPALWALPVIDFDDALGFTVLGNCFGELAIYDHVGQRPSSCCGLAADFTDQESPAPPLLSTIPIDLSLPVWPLDDATQSELNDFARSQWPRDDLHLGPSWKTTWFARGSSYRLRDRWQGLPGDLAWILEHAYGFPGRVTFQAFKNHPNVETGIQYLLFRSGNRYFVFSADEEAEFRICPLSPTLDPRDAQLETYTRRTAIVEQHIYGCSFGREGLSRVERFRNRWVEQADRGGRPPTQLVRCWS
ncbi:hypothetical protein DFH08DRAFT_867310 [Mycena albidolilacea]|uniref:F-box domain-containing protein n=1 Tax=Mycena albidolilacea TaxID=1033008 RepID=A0AAD7A3A4_9AGAR|nr:hypothetical protein DFH08DRAFT_867310 [Mycena albidolilacea]